MGLQAFTFHLAFDVEAFSDHLLDLLVIRTEIKGQVLNRGELLQGSTAMSLGVASRLSDQVGKAERQGPVPERRAFRRGDPDWHFRNCG